MARSRRGQTDNVIATRAVDPIVSTTGADIARRACELYESRGGEHGHDLDDWLQAERELRTAAALTAA
jgi:hypothetical protein